MVSHWSFSDSKSPQVSRTLLSIQADLNNAVVWMVSTRPLISKSSRPFINSLVTCGECFGEVRYFRPTIFVGSLLKSKLSKRYKTTWTKEHSKQSNTNKIKFIYQQIHKKDTLQNISNILI